MFCPLHYTWYGAPHKVSTLYLRAFYVGTGRLAGRKALVTGGDSGIGRAVAIAFAREGADVAINYLPEEESDAEEVVRLVEAEGRSIYTIPGDLTDENFCHDLVLQANVSLGGLDIVVSNAGFAFEHTSISNISTAQIERTFRTNVFAGMFITRAAVPLLPPGSSILFTASNIAANGAADLVDYAATKAALVSITRSLAVQLAPRGIRVNAVAPGLVTTNFLTSQGFTNEDFQGRGTSRPFGRPAQAAELAPLYVTLAEGRTSYTSGSIWGVHGANGVF
jgi:NAD(P)-dependent dehydrogenase (short-subunit alcohol dehydrogenase family)